MEIGVSLTCPSALVQTDQAQRAMLRLSVRLLLWLLTMRVCTLQPATAADGTSSSSGSAEAISPRDSLVAFFNSTHGRSWRLSTNWCTAAPICNWYGVTCSPSGDVTALRIRSNNLGGSLPPESFLAALPALTVLDLGVNTIRGTIPAMDALVALQELNMEYNQLSGDRHLDALPLC